MRLIITINFEDFSLKIRGLKMKRKYLQVFIICILMIIFLSPLNCLCQQEETKDNYREKWFGMGYEEKISYLAGVRDGILFADFILDEFPGLSDKDRELIADYYYTRYIEFNDNILVLKDIITSLYEDPANSNIISVFMIYVAMKKLPGVDIESMLRGFRKIKY